MSTNYRNLGKSVRLSDEGWRRVKPCLPQDKQGDALYKEVVRLAKNSPSRNTVARILERRKGVNHGSLVEFFHALGLHITEGDWESIAIGAQVNELPESIRDVAEHIFTLDPNDTSVHNELGDIAYAQERYREAEGHYRQALTLDPNSPVAYVALGNVAFAQERCGEAEAYYRQALTLNPNVFFLHVGLGMVACAQERYREAEAHYQQALALDPDISLFTLDRPNDNRAMNSQLKAINAVELVQFLTPSLPLLLKLGEETAKAVAKKVGEEAWEKTNTQATVLWERIHPKAQNDPKFLEAAENVAKTQEELTVLPEGTDLKPATEELEDYKRIFARRLQVLLDANPDLAPVAQVTVEQIVRIEGEAGNISQVAKREGNVKQGVSVGPDGKAGTITQEADTPSRQ